MFSHIVLRAIAVGVIVSAVIMPGMVPAARAGGDAKPVFSGASWLGGQGVNACGEADSSSASCGGETAVGIPWQCVELAQRLYNARGWFSGHFGANYAYQIFDRASAIGMTAHENGKGYIPVPGDLIIHTSADGGGDGHVAVVDYVSGSQVVAAEQNYNNTADLGTYTLNGSTLSRGSYHIRGVVHSPKDTLANETGAAPSGRIDLDWLTAGANVWPGQYILSSDGRYMLTFQTDGNLVVYYVPTMHALWSSRTGGLGANRFANQADGNLVVYRPSGAVWSSGTAGRGAAVLEMQTDGNAVLYLSGMVGLPNGATWASGTAGKK
jgi:CHAP domain